VLNGASQKRKTKDSGSCSRSRDCFKQQIFWRSAGGNALEGQRYELMTTCDTIVFMGEELKRRSN
jgi:hypothetical protein